MVLDRLRRRFSALLKRDAASDTDSSDDPEPRQRHRSGRTDAATYAEEVEYGVDERDLGDKDKLLRLLVKRGGRVDETTVLEETGWSEEHLEAVVADMEDEEQVSAIVVGRKRVICRRGFEPKGYRSHLTE